MHHIPSSSNCNFRATSFASGCLDFILNKLWAILITVATGQSGSADPFFHHQMVVVWLIVALLIASCSGYYDPYGTTNIPNLTQPACCYLYYDNYSAADDPNGPIGTDWADSLTLLCFSKVVHKTAVAFAATSVFCSILLIILLAMDEKGRKTQQGKNNQLLIVAISLGDIMYETAHGIDHIIYMLTDNTWGWTHVPACVAGGFFSFFGILFSSCIALLVALNLAISLWVSSQGKQMPFIHASVYVLTAAFVAMCITMIPAAAGFYGNAGFWCGPAADSRSALLFGFAIPIIVFVFLIFIIYLSIAAYLFRFFWTVSHHKESTGDTELKYQTLSSVIKMLFYPVVFAVVWFPICVYMLLVYSRPNEQHRIWAFLAVLFANQIGLWNFVFYFISARLFCQKIYFPQGQNPHREESKNHIHHQRFYYWIFCHRLH